MPQGCGKFSSHSAPRQTPATRTPTLVFREGKGQPLAKRLFYNSSWAGRTHDLRARRSLPPFTMVFTLALQVRKQVQEVEVGTKITADCMTE